MVINIQDDILRLRAVGLLEPLLKDKATKRNILWATDAYAERGSGYGPDEEIRTRRISGENSDLIKTRARRAMEQRTERTRQYAEVFSPLWVVKKMNDVADVEWFGRKDGFYKLTDEGKIAFTNKQKHWKLYVDARRLEITCGEAPFLVTRYDVETGEALPVEDRIGLLDRKLRVVSENAADPEEWKTWALRAVQSIYGYELQGDNLLIARVNILCGVEEHMVHRWRQKPDKAWMERLCNVISWNLWQMDGLRGCVPTEPQPAEEQLSLFPPEPRFEQENLFGEKKEKEISCYIHDWRSWRSHSYQALREKGPVLMKFDFIIGNPPYQEQTDSKSSRMLPLYDKFMEEAYKCGKKVELITPARFLFNAGFTSKEWNNRRLNDEHFKVIFYEADSSKVFPNVDLKGGVAVTYRDESQSYGAIGMFIPSKELNSIADKVAKHNASFIGLNTIICPRDLLHYSERFFADYPDFREMNNNNNVVNTNAFEKFPTAFLGEPFENSIPVVGRSKSGRVTRYIKNEYLESNGFIDVYKLIIPEVNGSGKFGETMAPSLFGDKGTAFTDTFICIGKFTSEYEVNAASKYIQTKFVRALLGILKKTQHNTADKWKYVPLQDFTPASDIDWSKSIPEIDRQLYAKYGLDAAEIEFIETHVKEMS